MCQPVKAIMTAHTRSPLCVGASPSAGYRRWLPSRRQCHLNRHRRSRASPSLHVWVTPEETPSIFVSSSSPLLPFALTIVSSHHRAARRRQATRHHHHLRATDVRLWAVPPSTKKVVVQRPYTSSTPATIILREHSLSSTASSSPLATPPSWGALPSSTGPPRPKVQCRQPTVCANIGLPPFAEFTIIMSLLLWGSPHPTPPIGFLVALARL
jgi:hypothetical protein